MVEEKDLHNEVHIIERTFLQYTLKYKSNLKDSLKKRTNPENIIEPVADSR